MLVLDEPTANLDVRAEAELFDRFIEITGGATTILISHRFSTVRRADRIVVLDERRDRRGGDARGARRARRPLRGALPPAGRALRASARTGTSREALARASSATWSACSLRIDRAADVRAARARARDRALGAAVRARDEGVRERRGRRQRARARWCFGALVGVLWIASVAIGHLVRPVAFELGDLNGLAFDAELIGLGGGSAGLEHLENPEYANRLELARSDGGDLLPRDAVPREPRAGSCSSCS